MSATTSGSIDIYGSQAACDQERVSRTMPAILSGRITSGDWTILCDDLDKALKPSAGIKKLTYAWHVVIPLAFVIFLMFGFLRLFASDENGFRWSSIVVVVMIVIVGNVCVLVIKSVQRNKIQKKLIEICDQTSASHPGISFHVRYEMRMGKQNSCESSEGNNDCDDCNSERRRDYIEVCVAPVASSSVLYSSSLPPVAVAEAYVVPTFVPSADPVMPSAPPKSVAIYPYDDPEMPIVKEKKTAEERMKDLDRMKDIITEEEYYRKRAEILSDI